MLFDTHAHLNFSIFKKEREKIIEKCLREEIFVINVGTNYKDSEKAVEIAQKYPKGIYAAIGLHPSNIKNPYIKQKEKEANLLEDFGYERYKKLAENKKVVAIGEIGLDYYYKPKTKKKMEGFKEKQREVLESQIQIARELNLPVIFHCRMAHRDLLEMLEDQINKEEKIRGVIHSFVGTLQELEKYLNMGFYIGFNGIIFKNINGINFEGIIKKTPLSKILLETDCPYLLPPQMRGYRYNTPCGVKYVAERIAQIKRLKLSKVAQKTTKNAITLFQLKT